MPKAQLPKDDEEWVKLVEQITAGADDRTAVILGATLVEVTLEAMLLSWLRPEKSVEEFFDSGFLSTANTKKNLAFALGLLDRDERASVQAIAKIRNLFAHHLLDATFKHPDLAGPLDQLRGVAGPKDSPRKRFVAAVTRVIIDLRMRTLEPRTPEEFVREVEARVKADWDAARERHKGKTS